MLDEAIVVLDFETTGLFPEGGDRVTEVGAVRVVGSRITDRFESLINCGARVPRHISLYTGITQQMVDTAPPVAHVFRDLLRFVGSTPIVAHNSSFDQRCFDGECQRLRVMRDGDDFICSVRMARRVFPELQSHALGALCVSLGIRFAGAAHRAGADAEVTASVLLRIAEVLKTKYALSTVNASVLRRLSRMPISSVASRLSKLAGASNGRACAASPDADTSCAATS